MRLKVALVLNVLGRSSLLLPSATKLRRLCFYTCVCVHRGVCLSACWDTPPQEQAPPPGSRHAPVNGYCCGWYASYWNAFLLTKMHSSRMRITCFSVCLYGGRGVSLRVQGVSLGGCLPLGRGGVPLGKGGSASGSGGCLPLDPGGVYNSLQHTPFINPPREQND